MHEKARQSKPMRTQDITRGDDTESRYMLRLVFARGVIIVCNWLGFGGSCRFSGRRGGRAARDSVAPRDALGERQRANAAGPADADGAGGGGARSLATGLPTAPIRKPRGEQTSPTRPPAIGAGSLGAKKHRLQSVKQATAWRQNGQKGAGEGRRRGRGDKRNAEPPHR